MDDAQLEEFLLREDVPDEAKQEAVALYDQAKEEAKAGAGEAKPTGAAAGQFVGEAAEIIDPEGKAREATEGKQSAAAIKAGGARIAGPLIGAAAGTAVLPGAGTLIGAGIGAGAGDWIAQQEEIEAGTRTAWNPLRTGAEIITAGYFSKFQAGKTLMQVAVKGGLGNMASDTFINLTEGKGLPSTFELAISGLTGSVLAGGGKKAEEIWHARKAAALEISGSHEVADSVADFMGPRTAGEQIEMKLKLPEKQLELSGKAAGHSNIDEHGIPVRRKAGPAETMIREEAGWPVPEPPTQPFVGPTQDIPKPGTSRVGAKKRFEQRRLWSERELTEQFGFEDLDDGRTFEKILTTTESPDGYSLNLKTASSADKPWTVHQISQDEQSEWARMKALSRNKKEMQETPLDRDPTFGDTSPITRYRGVANVPKEELTKRQKARLGRTEGTLIGGRAKDIFKRLEVDHDYPVYQDYHDSSQAYRRAQMDVGEDSKVATDAINGMSKADRISVMQAFMSGGDFSGMPRKLQQKASRLWGLADKQLGEYSLSAREYFSEYLPEVANGKTMKQIIEESSAPSTIPNRLRFAEDTTFLSPQDPSIVRIFNKLIDVGAYKRHVADTTAPLVLKYGKDGPAPQAIKEEMQHYLASLKGSTGDPSGEKIDKLFGMITKTFGSDMSGSELANYLIRNSYAGLMAARPSTVIRNAMQTIQTGIPVYGVKSFFTGLRRAYTEEGMDIARKAGILGGGNTLREFGLTTGRIAKAIDIGSKPFQFIEDKNRVISYLAGLDKFDRAVGKASKTTGRANWQTLMKKADIDMLSEPEIEVLAKMWDAGAPMEQIRHIYAQGIVDDTQFMYLMPERAKALQTQTGRVALGFGNWSQGYASYVARMAGQGPKAKRVRQALMFTGTNLGLATAFAKVGGVFGDDDGFNDAMGWLFAGPLFYTGGPIVTTAQSLVDTSRKMTQGQMSGKSILKQVGRDASVFTPFGGVAYDVYSASQESSKAEMAGRFLGFKRGKK